MEEDGQCSDYESDNPDEDVIDEDVITYSKMTIKKLTTKVMELTLSVEDYFSYDVKMKKV